MVAEHPLMGVGFGNFDLYQRDYFFRPRAFGSLSAPAAAGFYAGGTHNTLLTPIAELGVVVGGLYLVLVGWSIASAFVTMRAAARRGPPGREAGLTMCSLLVGVAFVINAFFVELRFTPTPNGLFWIFMGLVQGAETPASYAVASIPGPDRTGLRRPTHSHQISI
jgi:O-antigen ligase